MPDYKKPRISPAIIEQAASSAKEYAELMKLFETCELENIAEYNRRADAHLKIMQAIKAAGFYPDKVLKYMKQAYPASPTSLGRLKNSTRAKIEAEQERQARSQKQRDYKARWRERNAAAIETLTEHGYNRVLDYSAAAAISFLKSVTVAVEVPEGSGNWERRIQSKFPQLTEGEKP